MIGDHDGQILRTPVNPSPQGAHGGLRFQKVRGGESAQSTDDLRRKDLELSGQIRGARLYLLGLRIAIPRGAALQNVADVDAVLSGYTDFLEKLVEKRAGPAHEWNTGSIFLKARGLPHERESGIWVSLSEHVSGLRSMQPTQFTGQHPVFQCLQNIVLGNESPAKVDFGETENLG
jgi:hypothetical protein